jgi:hypothetical protein
MTFVWCTQTSNLVGNPIPPISNTIISPVFDITLWQFNMAMAQQNTLKYGIVLMDIARLHYSEAIRVAGRG